MSYKVEFVFAPKEHVEVIAYGLNFKGRVLHCTSGSGGNAYEVEYANGSYIMRHYFYADQLAKLEVKND